MRTQDQIDAIHGESFFEFQAFVGCGHSAVNVTMVYEYDSSGIYNETITAIRTMSGIDIIDYIEESTIDDICMSGCMLLNESKKEVY
jgi:hypothetical protein